MKAAIMKNEVKKGNIKKVFFGSNTTDGFYSFYDFLEDTDNAEIIILKGGPGVGKGSFIQYIGDAMVEKGFDIEFHFCALDYSSLDALVIPALKVAIIAGTGHHVLDPKNPGVIDKIINLGDYLNEAGLKGYKEEILSFTIEEDKIFSKVYRYLKIAKLIRDNIEDVFTRVQRFSEVNKLTDKIITMLVSNNRIADEVGKERHFFASAITTDGAIDFLDNIVNDCEKVYVVYGDCGTGKSTLLKKVANSAIIRGMRVNYYHCPLDPEKVEHILLPEIGVAFVTKNISDYNNCSGIYDLNDYLNNDIISKYNNEILEDKEKFNSMINEAVKCLRDAKRIHKKMEEYYVPNMNFDAVNKVREEVLQKILRRA